MKYQQEGEQSKLELVKKEDNIIADYGYKLLSPKILNEVLKELFVISVNRKRVLCKYLKTRKPRKVWLKNLF